MELKFDDLKYLVTVVAKDLLNDDFCNFQCEGSEPIAECISDVSEEMYDKVLLLKGLLDELYKYRPLPF